MPQWIIHWKMIQAFLMTIHILKTPGMSWLKLIKSNQSSAENLWQHYHNAAQELPMNQNLHSQDWQQLKAGVRYNLNKCTVLEQSTTLIVVVIGPLQIKTFSVWLMAGSGFMYSVGNSEQVDLLYRQHTDCFYRPDQLVHYLDIFSVWLMASQFCHDYLDACNIPIWR